MDIGERARLFRSRDLTLGTFLERLAGVRGGDRLVQESGDGGLDLTYDEAADLVARVARAIAAKIGAGDRVVVAAPNGYALFLLCLGASRAGGVAVPVNPQMRQEEIDHVVGDCGARLTVDSLDLAEGVEPAEAVPAEPKDVAALFYTSGTTGKPKGVELTHAALVGSAGAATAFPARLLGGEVVCGLPVAHIAGFAGLVQMAALGTPVFLLRKFRPDDALDAIESRRATMFLGVPAMYRMMMEAGAEDRDLSSVRVWTSGADAMPFELARKFQKMGATITIPFIGRTVGEAAFIDGYGMVELGGGAAIKILPPGIPLPLGGLVGIPLPGYHMSVVDDRGVEVERGEVGELAVKGPGVMKGYHGREDATAEAMTPDGWMRTGDLARRRRMGLVEFAGRKKDVIKHGGYSVFAVEVEQSLGEHPAVAEAAVIGLTDERKGEIPVAVVRLRSGSTLDEDELVGWAKGRMSDYKVPQRVVFVDDLPRTGTEKVQKSGLKDLFA
ncbi:MAG: AMP-binding protein [Actinomycetota bacterium]|nr:AMP-binding protein [Actinomycetota bacterium]